MCLLFSSTVFFFFKGALQHSSTNLLHVSWLRTGPVIARGSVVCTASWHHLSRSAAAAAAAVVVIVGCGGRPNEGRWRPSSVKRNQGLTNQHWTEGTTPPLEKTGHCSVSLIWSMSNWVPGPTRDRAMIHGTAMQSRKTQEATPVGCVSPGGDGNRLCSTCADAP